MKPQMLVRWDESKNEWLKTHRGLSFEAVFAAIEEGQILADIEHPNLKRKHQRLLVVELAGNACVVPYVRDGATSFLKTVYRSRDMNKKYLGS